MFVKLKIVRTLTSQRVSQGSIRAVLTSLFVTTCYKKKKKKRERKLTGRDKGGVVAWKKDQP